MTFDIEKPLDPETTMLAQQAANSQMHLAVPEYFAGQHAEMLAAIAVSLVI